MPKTNPLAGKLAPADTAGRSAEADHGVLHACAPTRRSPRSAWRSARRATAASSFQASFNEAHVLAMTQAICSYRKQQGITGPLFLGFDTHALSAPAFASCARSAGGQ